MKKTLLSVAIVAFVLFAFWSFYSKQEQSIESVPSPSPEISLPQITVGDNKVSVRVAKTDRETSLGLGGTTHLDENEGMFFFFAQKPTSRTFWMKDMLIPIDIIWIRNNKVVQIDENVPAPSAGTPDNALPLYPSFQPIDYVLEMNAGWSQTHNVKVGTPVDISSLN